MNRQTQVFVQKNVHIEFSDRVPGHRKTSVRRPTDNVPAENGGTQFEFTTTGVMWGLNQVIAY